MPDATSITDAGLLAAHGRGGVRAGRRLVSGADALATEISRRNPVARRAVAGGGIHPAGAWPAAGPAAVSLLR